MRQPIPPAMLVPHTPSTVRCQYCGQQLQAGYYFCTACAMPFCEVEQVLPEVRPAQWDDETRVRREVPEAWRLFLYYVGALLVCGIAGFLLFPEADGDLPRMMIELLAVAGVSVGFGIVHRDILRPQFLGTGVANRVFVQGLLLLAAVLIVNFLWHSFLWHMAPEKLRGHDFEDLIGLVPSVAGRVVLICIMPAVFEEIGFRGLIQTWLMRVLSPWKAVALAGALFSAAHFSVLSAPYLLMAGCLFGWVRWRTGRILPAMILHFLHNLAVLCYEGLLH